MNTFDEVVRLLVAMVAQSYAVKILVDSEYRDQEHVDTDVAVGISSVAQELGFNDVVEILKRAQGNRRDGTKMSAADTALVFASVHKRCVEVLEGEAISYGDVDAPEDGD